MQEDVLLHMYRKAWDEFLEAYKVKMNQNEALIEFCGDLISTIESERPAGGPAKPEREKLGHILEV